LLRAAIGTKVELQELLVGVLLHLDQVRHLRDFADTAKTAADTLAACEAFNTVGGFGVESLLIRFFGLDFGF
jgi:hypothetical protein